MADNGRLPASALAAIPGGRLRRDAALSWNAMCGEAQARQLTVPRPTSSRTAYRTFAEQEEFWRLYKAGGSLAARPGTSNHGLGIAVDLATPAMRHTVDRIGAKYGWSKKWSDAPCVPLSTRILTRRGYVAYDEIREGDETVGYDIHTGRTAWTPIQDVVRHRSAEVVRYAHSSVSVECTRDHRWIVLPRSGLRTARRGGRGYPTGAGAELLSMDEVGPASQRSVLLAAEGASGDGLPITPSEAALIGWAMTDGSIYRFENSCGSRAFARVYQSKAVGVSAVDALMDGFQHRRDDSYVTSGIHAPCVMWYVGRAVFSPILSRSRLDELGPVRFVLALDADQRRAWLDAVRMAEGTQPSLVEVAQSEPENREAIAIAAFLEGNSVALRARTVNLKRAAIRRSNLKATPLGSQDVWCVTTKLGTWTAEQDGQTFLTGNSEWWHIRFDPARVTVDLTPRATSVLGTKAKRWAEEYLRLKAQNRRRARRAVLRRLLVIRRRSEWVAANKGPQKGRKAAQRRYEVLARIVG